MLPWLCGKGGLLGRYGTGEEGFYYPSSEGFTLYIFIFYLVYLIK